MSKNSCSSALPRKHNTIASVASGAPISLCQHPSLPPSCHLSDSMMIADVAGIEL
jgi:hypothetical protein